MLKDTTHSEESRKKMSFSHFGLTYPDRKTPKFSEEHKRKLSEAKIGNTYTLGRIPWNKGLIGAQESKYKGKNMSWMQKERHHMWKGGISRLYPSNWKEIRKEVYKRDRFTCQRNDCKNADKRVPLDVHHIDDNPNNNILSNLIALCRSCHVKTTWQLLNNQ